MASSILICGAAFFGLLWILRGNRCSLGLPIAYLFTLLLNHVPGAYAHLSDGAFLLNSELVELGMYFTAIGSVCFTAGVWLSRSRMKKVQVRCPAPRHAFSIFCLLGGWLLTYGLSPLFAIPSVSAAVGQGAAVWMLGVMIGLRSAFQRVDLKWIAIWLGSLMVYPVLMLLLGGFLSYGAQTTIIVFSVLAVSTRSYWRVGAGLAVIVFLSLSLFVNYFAHREKIRDQVWGGAPLQSRIDSVLNMFRDFQWLDMTNQEHLNSLDARLNQNYFVGLAARRIQDGQVGYLYGSTIRDGFLALIPRALWPEKTVFAGSPEIVGKMTGLRLSTTTSFGIGNVMEFQVNFGTPGVIIGFLILGLAIGTLDLKAAVADGQGRLGEMILFVLPAIALIQPIGSIVELFGGCAAALPAAFAWKVAWNYWDRRRSARSVVRRRQVTSRSLASVSGNNHENPPYCNEPAS